MKPRKRIEKTTFVFVGVANHQLIHENIQTVRDATFVANNHFANIILEIKRSLVNRVIAQSLPKTNNA